MRHLHVQDCTQGGSRVDVQDHTQGDPRVDVQDDSQGDPHVDNNYNHDHYDNMAWDREWAPMEG